MATLSPNLQHLTDELPADKRADIEAAIVSSPYLRQLMTEAVAAGTLQHIRLGQPGANEGGHYDARENAVYISPSTFTEFPKREKRLDAITSTLGHETGHALYAEKAEKERTFTTYSITEGIRAAGQDGEFDATGLMNGFIRSSRRDEALAEIHGWNALASRIEYIKGKPPSRDEVLERIDASTDCVDEIKGIRRLAPGIILDADMYMSDTRLPKAGPINLEPVAQCHFDNPRTSLGAGGAADYTNYYGAYLVQQLADETRNWVNSPTVKLDMAKLGLDKTQLESTALRLGDQGFSLIDTSQGRYKPIVLRSSGSGIQGTPDSTEVALDEFRTRALGDETLQQASPERTITQATPEERDAREQAQREANRQGLSQEDVQQAVDAATIGASARAVTMAGTDARIAVADAEEAPQTQPERVQNTPAAQAMPQAAAVAAMARDARDDDGARMERERTDAERNATEREQAQADTAQSAQQTRAATDDRHTSAAAVEAPREQVQPPTVAVAPEREASPEPERVAAKTETTAAPERQTEIPPPISADREPQNGRTVATPTPTHDPDALRLGDRGESVELLQYRLDRQGYRGQDGEQIPQTGQYGPETEHAVRQFQTLHGIPATGVADQDTRDAVDRALVVQRERERGEPSGPNRSTQESTPARETPEPDIAPRTAGLSATAGRGTEDKPEPEREPARAEAQPVALAVAAPDPAHVHRDATRDDKQTAAPLLDNPAHPNHGMYATLLEVVHERDRALGRTPDEHSKQLAGGLTERALSQGLTAIGAAKFSDDGKVVGMTDTPNLSAEWARTSAGNAAEMAGRPLAQSSEGAVKLSEQIEQARTLQAQIQTQTPPTHDDLGPKGPKL